MTRGDIVEAVESQLKISLNTDDVNDWLNQLEEDFWNVISKSDPLRNYTEVEFVISSSGTALPSDFAHINSKELGFFAQDADTKYTLTSENGSQGYYIKADTVYFNDVSGTVDLRYITSYSPKTTYSESDTLIFPNTNQSWYKKLAKQWLLAEYYSSEEDLSEEIAARGLFEDMWNKLLTRYDRETISINITSKDTIY